MYSERDYDVYYAICNAKNYLMRKKINFKINKMLTDNSNLYTTSVTTDILDKNNETIVGNGKGIGDESIASALFEFIEHYSYIYDSPKSFIINKEKQDKIFNEPMYLKEVPILFLLEYNAPVKLLKYVDNKNIEKYYPKFLTQVSDIEENLFKEYPTIMGYSTNSGCASGMTTYEAKIHGINEILERDLFSKFLIFNIIKKNALCVVSPDNISIENKKIYNTLRKNVYKDDLLIINVPNNYGVNMFITINRRDKMRPLYGAGVSLSEDYALQRSLTECLQLNQLNDKDEDEKFKDIVKNYKNYNQYLDLIYLNIDGLKSYDYIQKGKNIFSKYNNKEKLSYLESMLNKLGYTPQYRTIIKDGNINVIQSIIPGMEKFNLVIEGNPVIPGPKYSK